MLQYLPSSLMAIPIRNAATQFVLVLPFGRPNDAPAASLFEPLLTVAASKSTEILPSMAAPRAAAIMWMALAMALHFGGYEFARSSSLALFTSPAAGFHSPSAFPLAMGCVSPFSLLLLLLYGNELNQHGPRVALRHSTLGSIAMILCSAIFFPFLHQFGGTHTMLLQKGLVGVAFVFMNSYAHLLYTQYWSFLGSIMDTTEGSTWFATIAGLSSVFSTVTGALVGPLVQQVGLYGLLACTALGLTGSLWCGERAYQISEQHGFDPSLEMTKNSAKKTSRNSNPAQTAARLFQEQPMLKALFMEVMSFQSLSTILNVCFVTKLKSLISNDMDRAAWTGKFYSSISAVSGVAQFLILPLFMKRIEPKWVWRLMPLLPLACTITTSLQGEPSLYLLAFAFFSAKVMDYSVRGVVNEMVYVPLDFESRYLGKEVIGVFGNRFGKSGMSLVLSAWTFIFGRFGVMSLTKLSTLASFTWMASAWRLSGGLPTKEQAQATVDQRRKEQDNEKKDI